MQLWHSLETQAFSGTNPREKSQLEVPLIRLKTLYNSIFSKDVTPLGSVNALFSQHGIQFSEYIRPADFDSTLAHEISHVLIEEICPGKMTADFFVHETISQWISRDYVRVSYSSSQFAYSQKAQSWLREWKDHSSEQKTASYAIARILLHIKTSQTHFEDLVSDIFSHCRSEKFDLKTYHDRMILMFTESRLNYDRSQEKPAQNPDLFIVDGLSMEPILDSGNTKSAFPPGSVLKPLLIALIPELRVPSSQGASIYWNCNRGSLPTDLQWSWQQALIHSCNGFFLEHHRLKYFSFKGWIDLLNEFKVEHPFTSDDVQNPNKVLQVSLGLTPGMRITPLQLVGLYRWLYDHSPDIILALLETSSTGTLREVGESSWFYDQKIALKTGTLRNNLNQPLDAWIVGLGPIKKEKFGPDFVFAVHGNGQAPPSLVPHVLKTLKTLESGVGFLTKVQILSKHEIASGLEIRCKNQLYALTESAKINISDTLLPKTVVAIPKGDLQYPEIKTSLLTCYEGPLILQDQLRTAKSYEYYGRLRILPPQHSYQNSFPWPVSSSRAKTRKGSSLVIETSARHYIKNVIASEYPNGYEATLKALALAAGYNAQSHRHDDRPLCDSSHCQIFSSSQKLMKTLKQNRLNEIVQWSLKAISQSLHNQAIMEKKLDNECAPRAWYPFSLGGREEWSQNVSHGEIAAAFNFPDSKNIGVSFSTPETSEDLSPTKYLLVHHRYAPLKMTCETFRNQMKLPSCPQKIFPQENSVRFYGRGEGHGQGIDLKESDLFAGRGFSGEQIFKRYFPKAPPFCHSKLLSNALINL
jgi:hypothetical protein